MATVMLAFFVGAALAFLLAGPSGAELAARRRLRHLAARPAPAREAQDDLEEPFVHRVVRPAWLKVSQAVLRYTPSGYLVRLQERLAQAGEPAGMAGRLLAAGPAALVLAKVGGALAGMLVTGWAFLPVWAGAVLGWYAPDLWLAQRIQARRAEMARQLPDTLDLLCVSVEAGMGFDGAVQHVAEKLGGAMGAELMRYLKEVRLGRSREEALRALAERAPLPEVKSWVAAVLQAERMGVSLARVLRVQARQIRLRRRQRAEEQAMRLPIKLVFPLVFFIFPSLLAVLLGPALLRLLLVVESP